MHQTYTITGIIAFYGLLLYVILVSIANAHIAISWLNKRFLPLFWWRYYIQHRTCSTAILRKHFRNENLYLSPWLRKQVFYYRLRNIRKIK